MEEVEPKRRVCLACKGQKYLFDYGRLKFTRTPCTCCEEDGKLPYESALDGYGPFRVVQHIITTEIVRGSRVIGKTTDVHGPYTMPPGEITLQLNGLFTMDELDGLGSLLQKLKESHKVINCNCCSHLGL